MTNGEQEPQEPEELYQQYGLRKVTWQEYLKAPKEQRLTLPRMWTDADYRASYENYQPQMNQARQQREYLPNGLPADWDYKQANATDQRGPWGEELPVGALGWNNYGQPYYERTIGGWFKRYLDQFLALRWDEDRVTDPGILERNKPPDFKYYVEREDDENFLDVIGYDIGVVLQRLKYGWTKAEQSADSPLGLRYISTFVGAFVSGLGSVLTLPEQLVKYVGTPVAIAGDEWWKDLTEKHEEQLRGVSAFYNLLGETEAPGVLGQVLKVVAPVVRSGVSFVMGIPAMFGEEYRERAADYHQEQIWRMGYTAILNTAARENYMQRRQSGEDPQLLAWELESPSAEFWGGLIWDPLNYWDATIGKSLKNAKDARKSYRIFESVTDDLADLGDDLAKSVDSAGTGAAAAAQRTVFVRIRDTVANMRNGMDELGGRRGPFVLTSGGKQFVYGQRASSWAGSALFSPQINGNPDKMGDLIMGMVKIANPAGNLDEIVEGTALLARTGYPHNLIFSEGGLQAGIIFRNIMTDPKTGALISADDFIKKLTQGTWDPEKALEQLQELTGRTLKGVFPNVQEQVAQGQELAGLVAKYGDESTEVAQYLAKYPQAATAVGDITQLLAKGYEATAPLRKLFGGIQGVLYMGLSPAYYVRNKLSNTFHIFVDQGPKAAVRAFFTPGAAEAQLKAMLGFIPDAAARGIGPLGSFVDKPPKGILNYFSQASMATEQGASMHIYNNSVRDTFMKALKPGIAIPVDLLESSSDEVRDSIVKLAQRHNGNSSEVLDAILDAQTTGGHNVARNLLFLSSDDVDDLKKIGLWDHMWGAATEEETLEDALARMDDVVRDWGRRGNLAAGETPEVLMGELPPMVQAELADAIRAESAIPGRAGRDASDLIRRSTIANRDAISERAADLSAIKRRAEVEIVGNHVAEAMAEGSSADAVQRAKNTAHDLLENLTAKVEGQMAGAGQSTATMADDLHAATRNLSELSEIDGADLADLWRRARELEVVSGEFVDMSPQQFRDILWPGWRARRGNLWTGFRERQLGLMEGEARALARAAWGEDGYDEVRRVFTRSDGVVENARMFDNARLVGGVPYVYYEASEDGIRAMVYQATTPTTRQAQAGYKGLIVGEVVEGKITNPISGREVDAYININRVGEVVTDERTGRVVVTVSQDLLNQSPDRIREVIVHEMAHSLQLNLPDALKAQADELFPIATAFEILMEKRYESKFANQFSSFLYLREVGGKNLSEALSELGLERRHGELFQAIIDDAGSAPLLSAMRGTNRIEEVVQLYSPTQQLVRTAYADVLAETSPRALRESAIEELRPIHVKKLYGTATEQELARYEELLTEIKRLATAAESPSWETVQKALHKLKKGRISAEDALANGYLDATMYAALARAEGDPAKLLQGLIDDAELPANFRLPVMTPVGDGWHSESRVLHETGEEARRMVDNVKRGLRENWGQLRDASLSPQQHRELNAFLKEMDTRMATVRTRAMSIAQQARDFALHAYPQKYGIDLALGMIYPYQFWHSRTFLRWMERLVYNPGMIAGYFKYRRFLEKEHAGDPDWLKYNINTNELLGIDAKNPMYFNLEQTLNPLYGLTGVDFTDSRRRVDWLSSTMEDLSKFGPSIWTPYQLALATLYHARGQDEAASRWAGRLWTGTRAIRDITALLGFKEGMGIEVDPFVNFFGGGLGPYERPRVGRQFNALLKEGNYSEAELLDAAYNQEGPIWDEAVTRAIHERAPGQIASFFAGAGFKPRSQEDIEVDRFYSEMNGLYLMKDNMTPEEWIQAWDDLEARYPFKDAILMSRKGGEERDEALAQSVLGRIPPGAKDEYAEMVGLDSDILSNFYDNKGISEMSKSEKMHFMASILDLSAILEMPDGATQEEWDDVRAIYREMRELMKAQFGENIWERVDAYWNQPDELKDDFLRRNPTVEAALDRKQLVTLASPMLTAYYAGLEGAERYLKRQMYTEAEKLFGEDLWDHWEVHSQLADADRTAARQYWKDHPQLKGYMEFKEGRLAIIAQRLAKIGPMIPTPKPVVLREGVELEEEIIPEDDKDAWIRAQVLSYLSEGGDIPYPQQPAMPSQEELRQVLGESGYNLLMDYLYLGEDLPEELRTQLEQLGLGELIEQSDVLQTGALPTPPPGASLPPGALAASKEANRLVVERMEPERVAKPLMDYMVEIWTAPVVNRGVELTMAGRFELPTDLLGQVVDEGRSSSDMEEDESVEYFEAMLNFYIDVLIRGRIGPAPRMPWDYPPGRFPEM